MWPAGRPGRFALTLVNVAMLSRVTWTLPSSVPAQMMFGLIGDSLTVMTVLYCVRPSFFDSIVTFPGWPMRLAVFRSYCLVRSGLAIQVSPRSYDLNTRLPPRSTTDSLWLER